MWRAEHDGSASSGVTSVPRVPELAGRPASLNVSQHPPANPTPFSTFPTAWSIGSASANDYSSLHARPSATAQAPSTMAPAPSDLLPHGLLTTPQPSTPATTLLKVLASRGLTISSGPDATYGNNIPANGASGDSPGNSTGGALPPLDSLVLPSPSLLPGGVHSLPTPTSTSSQQPRAHETYGSRGSPADTGSSKESTASPRGEPPVVPKAQARPSVTTSTRHPDQQPQQTPSRNASGGGVGGVAAHFQGRSADGSSTSGHAPGPPHMQQALGGYGVAAGGMPAQGHGTHHTGGFQMQSHHGHPNPATGVGVGMPQASGSPTVGYTQVPFYMAPMPPGPMMMGMHHHGGSVGTGAGVGARSSVGSNGPVGPAREGSAGNGWRGNRSGGGSGGHIAPGATAARDSQNGKQSSQYGHGPQQQQQQQMQGPLAVHDGAAASYGMAHMHPGPYAVYGMMTPSIVVPQVLSPVVGSPRGMEAHGPLAHAPSHMGPMVMPHGPPSIAVGMGHMGPMGPVHPFQAHGAIVPGSHMGPVHPLAASHHGGPPRVGGYPHLQQQHHHQHSMGGGYQGNHPAAGQGSGGGGYGQQSYGLGGSLHSHTGFYHAGPRSGAGKGLGAGAGVMQQQHQQGYSGGAKGHQLAARVVAGNGFEGAAAGVAAGGVAAAGNSARDNPLAGRVRAGGREKADKSRAAEQRERKPGNSRAPAAIAQCATDLSALDEQLHDLVRQLTTGEDELVKHQAAFVAVRELVEARWPDVKVHLFGSAANGLCIAGANEIDITLEVPNMAWDDHPTKAAMVSELGELAAGGPAAAAATAAVTATGAVSENLAAGVAQEGAAPAETEVGGDATRSAAPAVEAAAAGSAAKEREGGATGLSNGDENGDDTGTPTMAAVSALPKARTPVVKLTVSETQTRVDITINNLLALSNTRLLDDYCKLDPRLRQLALLVKHWAKSRGVNDAYRGSLSSYAYVLLCIWLLQQRQPAILPVLQQRQPHTYDTTVGLWRCSYNDAVEDLAGFGARNKECLAQLLVAFFDHWAWRHDYNGSVVCVRTGGTMAKSAKDWTKRQGNERHLMCIEDPFELSHDLGRTIDKAAVQVLRREFERAARIFASNLDPLPELLAPLTPEEEAAIAAALQSRRKASKERDKEKRAASAAAAGTGADGFQPREANGDAAAATVAGDSGAEPDGGSQPVSEPGVLASRGSEEGQETDEEEGGFADG